VYRNRMINVMLTNVKLYHRASRIVSETAGCDIGTGSACSPATPLW
jgi:N-acetylmuramic acid 6-phosphate (MurNAc-6-P) etherase